MTPERLLEHAETVRELYVAERELERLNARIAAGRAGGLVAFRDRLAERIATTIGGAA